MCLYEAKGMDIIMNIREAKEEIKNTVRAYLLKDEAGEYRIPSVRQRPVLLMGPPGIGKTQIMEQAARELRIGLVAYTITHHTRQSAVGLPFIRQETFDGEDHSVTEYTMSEIIASVYRKIRDNGQREGILFIDEINCVSETLAPTMLQFLQCKTFGNQKIPEGWVIVAAGNPPEFNKSVREFDMVTLDRVRYLTVTADLMVWREYANRQQIHGAILSYLELRPAHFYQVKTDVDGMQFVTARGWEDLSSLMKVYEELDVMVDENVVRQFLHHEEIAADAAAYFALYRKYQDDYGIADILAGNVRPTVYARLEAAAFDERVSVVNLLLDALHLCFRETAEQKLFADRWYAFLKELRSAIRGQDNPSECYRDLLRQKTAEVSRMKNGGCLSSREEKRERLLCDVLAKDAPEFVPGDDENTYFAGCREKFAVQTARLECLEHEMEDKINHAFDFIETAFLNEQELVMFVTGLTLSEDAALFLAEHPNERYQTYSEQLLLGTKRAELLQELRSGES